MPQVLKLPQAETDLDDIWWYIAQDNADAADRFLDKIEDRCQTLAQFPNMGMSRDELLPSLRSLPIGKYLIFYVPIDDGIQVVRVLPAMMDIDAFF
ncbi:MAG: type II toxin-antitoxin system RelE/ParE family toxin [Desulfobaccales bacterium]